LTDTVQDKPRVRALAWIALGVSVLVTALVFWSNSSESSAFYRAIFGYAFGNAIIFVAAIYILAFALDIISVIALKGWRNRVIALAGIIVLLVPVAWGIWVAESPIPS
jgi:hypothetical protein